MEIVRVIGKLNGPIQESDISQLPYIQTVVKETLRLHPPVPFLLPHEAKKDVDLCGYFAPKNAQIWVNVWAIGRDPSVWLNAFSFLPERVMESDVDVKGRDFDLIPFGAGRRICPGMPLAHRMVQVSNNQDLFVAGTDTTSSTLEWAMTELLRNQEKMAKAQDELNKIIGKNTIIQESDISKLPYIQAVVKETFRLHPPAPFLIPRKAEKDVQLCGFSVPKDAQIWVNVWSIGRDSSVWPNALSFLPERFKESEVDFKGQSFELLPFGAGRRICPGVPLAYRMVHLMLATLLHSFNWKHAHGLSPEDIDMEEKFGVTLQKVQPLQAIPFIR